MELFDVYKTWVRRHADLISAIESGLSSVTWLLPDRFDGNELLLEGLHTITNLITLVNESILRDMESWAPKGAQELTLALQALQQVEILVEVYTLHSSGKQAHRYDALIALESLKAMVRLGIYRVSGTRLMLQGGSTCFDKFDPSVSSTSSNSKKYQKILDAFEAFRKRHLPPITPDAPWLPDACEMRSDLQVRDTRSHGEDYWWEHPKPQTFAWENIHASLTGLDAEIQESKKTALAVLAAGEVLHILRPVLITTSAQISSSKRAAEAADKSTLVNPTISALYAMQGIAWNREEMDELSRRKMLLLFYLLRDPLFRKVTRPAMYTWLRTTKRVPLVSWLSEKLTEFTEGIQKYYTYTAAS
ncbi:hypothetical protein M9434_004297 [Picochlorum sp. BPE23]|nr:hypothetical protein M9435_002394 [Picochlorum sp. BPE23]KAI8110721.1 hypothetical protein M9434_004297 [Picochlorum sp. BPE23]